MLILKLSRKFAAFFNDLNPARALVLLTLYALISYLGFVICGESDLVELPFFLYWLVVTASTVGYGDASPVTVSGQLLTSIWVIPLGIALFAMIVTKIGMAVSEILLKNLKGFGVTNHENHIVVIGWNGNRTLKLLNLLNEDGLQKKNRVELYVTSDINNPMPTEIDMIRVDRFNDDEQMRRGSFYAAKQIIIDTELDDVTVTTALYCSKHAPNAHITAYLKEESTAKLMSDHCPNVEIVPDVAIEMMAKAALDKGSSVLHKELLDATKGETQYSFELSEKIAGKTYLELLIALKTNYAATLIGFKPPGTQQILVNANNDAILSQGSTVYYIADTRLALPELETKLDV